MNFEIPGWVWFVGLAWVLFCLPATVTTRLVGVVVPSVWEWYTVYWGRWMLVVNGRRPPLWYRLAVSGYSLAAWAAVVVWLW